MGFDDCHRDSLKHTHTSTLKDVTTRLWRSRVLRFNPYSLSSPEIRTRVRLHKVDWQTRIGPRMGDQQKTCGRRHGSSSAGLEKKVVVINTHFCPHPPDPYQDKSNRKQIRTTLSPPLFASPCSSCPPVPFITQSHTSPAPLSTDQKEFPPSYSLCSHRHLASSYFTSTFSFQKVPLQQRLKDRSRSTRCR